MKTLILTTAMIICSYITLIAGDDNKYTIGVTQVIKSHILDEERTIIISLPPDYSKTNKQYPVLYVLDGNTHFQHAVAASDYLSQYGLTPEMIIVAITNVDRNRDFTSVYDESVPTSGGAKKFHNFIDNELMPTINKSFRTSNYNILMGHSFGGTFVSYSLLDHPSTFDAYIAISPYLQYADNYMIKQAKKKLRASYDKSKSLYMTVGDEPDYFEPLDSFSALLEEKSDEAIKFLYVQMPGENHASTPYLSLFNGLRFIYSDWVLPNEIFVLGLEAIDDHYLKVSKKYNYEVVTHENTINLLGYNYLRVGEIDESIATFKENVKRNPNSANVYDSLGEAYENNNQPDLAKVNYQKACKLGKEQNLGTLSVFEENLKRVTNILNK